MFSITRPDDQRQQITRLHHKILKRTELMFFRPACGASRQTLSSIPATQLHQPGNSITAANVSPLDAPSHVHRTRDRTSPADCHSQFRRGMNTHTVRRHVAWDSHKII